MQVPRTPLLAGLTLLAAGGLGFSLARRSALPPVTALTPAQRLAQLPAGDPARSAPASDRALATWRRKLSGNPDDDRAWSALGDSLRQKLRETLDHRYIDWAESAYQQALALQPKQADALTGMAWVASERHQFDACQAWGRRALALDQKNQAAWGLIGDAQTELGDYDGAMTSYQKMLDIRPDLSSYSRGARILYLEGKTRQALYLIQRAIDAGGPHAENTAWCRAQLGEMLFHLGLLLPAEQTVTRALQMTPENYHLQMMMGRIKTARKDRAGAIACFEKAAALAPQQMPPWIALGDLYQREGQAAKADSCYEKAEAIHATHPRLTPRDDLAIARLWADRGRRLGDALKIADANRDVASPVDADTVAWIYFKNGRIDAAQAFMEKAMAKGDPDASRLFHAGMIYARLGNREQASKRLYQALNRNPYFSPLDVPVAVETLKQVGHRATARSAMKRGV